MHDLGRTIKNYGETVTGGVETRSLARRPSIFPPFFARCSLRRRPSLRAFTHYLNAWNRLWTDEKLLAMWICHHKFLFISLLRKDVQVKFFYMIFPLPGIQNLSLISAEQLFLCESGDEIRSLNDRCNKVNDCNDHSDEKDCAQCKFERQNRALP